MKEFFAGVVLIIVLGFGGLIYRNAVEHPNEPVACPMDARLCPDGTAVGRTGTSCTFPACPPPNVSLDDINIAFALPTGFASTTPDEGSIATYLASPDAASSTARIVIRRFPITGSSTAADIITATAIGGASGASVPVSAISSKEFNYEPYTIVSIERFEGVIDTAYYLKRQDRNDVLRFDAIDTGSGNWTDPNLDISTLPAQAALPKLLMTLVSTAAPAPPAPTGTPGI